jgi:hypothetical protein
MNIYNQYKKLCLIVFVLAYVIIIPQYQYGEDLQDRPDSIRYILGIDVDGSILAELPGQDILQFKLYTTDKQSKIVWKYKEEYYIYSIDDENHMVRATELFKLMKANGISTFVAVRKETNIRLEKYHKVLAIQFEGSK